MVWKMLPNENKRYYRMADGAGAQTGTKAGADDTGVDTGAGVGTGTDADFQADVDRYGFTHPRQGPSLPPQRKHTALTYTLQSLNSLTVLVLIAAVLGILFSDLYFYESHTCVGLDFSTTAPQKGETSRRKTTVYTMNYTVDGCLLVDRTDDVDAGAAMQEFFTAIATNATTCYASHPGRVGRLLANCSQVSSDVKDPVGDLAGDLDEDLDEDDQDDQDDDEKEGIIVTSFANFTFDARDSLRVIKLIALAVLLPAFLLLSATSLALERRRFC